MIKRWAVVRMKRKSLTVKLAPGADMELLRTVAQADAWLREVHRKQADAMFEILWRDMDKKFRGGR